MTYHYDPDHDALLVTFREDADYDDSEEIYEGFVIDFDKSGRPLNLDISNASKFVDMHRLMQKMAPEESAAATSISRRT